MNPSSKDIERAKCWRCHQDIHYNHDEATKEYERRYDEDERKEDKPVVICDDCDYEIKNDLEAPPCDCTEFYLPHTKRQHWYIRDQYKVNPEQKWVITGNIVVATSFGDFLSELRDGGFDVPEP